MAKITKITGRDAGPCAFIKDGKVVGLGRKFKNLGGNKEVRVKFKSEGLRRCYMVKGDKLDYITIEGWDGPDYFYVTRISRFNKPNTVTRMAKLQRWRDARENEEAANPVSTGWRRSGDAHKIPPLFVKVSDPAVQKRKKERENNFTEEELIERLKKD